MKFLDAWCTRTMRSRIGPMKKIGRSQRRHRHLILNWFRVRGTISSGVVEGFNGKGNEPPEKRSASRRQRALKSLSFTYSADCQSLRSPTDSAEPAVLLRSEGRLWLFLHQYCGMFDGSCSNWFIRRDDPDAEKPA